MIGAATKSTAIATPMPPSARSWAQLTRKPSATTAGSGSLRKRAIAIPASNVEVAVGSTAASTARRTWSGSRRLSGPAAKPATRVMSTT